MDFVLDLVSPNILPNRTRNLGAQQYTPSTSFQLYNPTGTAMTAGTYQYQFKIASTSYTPTITAPGTIYEIVLDGTNVAAIGANSISDWLTTYNGAATPTNLTPNLLVSGSRFYMVAFQNWDSAGDGGAGLPGSDIIYLAASTLADAIGLVGSAPGINVFAGSTQRNSKEFQLMSSGLVCRVANWGGYAILSQQNAFIRILSSPLIGNIA